MATSSSQAKVSLKLMIDTKAKRVLFAEAGKDFVDFLFNLLHLPVGTMVRLLAEQTMVGTLGNLYESIQNLSESYFLSKLMKDFVLKPNTPIYAPQVPLLSFDGGSSVPKKYYTCSGNGPPAHNYNSQYHGYVAGNAGAVCPTCRSKLSQQIRYVAEANEVVADGEGFVKGVVTYMVMDDLVVTPLSTVAITTTMNKFNVKDVGTVEERVVDLVMPEGLKLLKASLHSKTVLTSVFLEKTTSGVKMER